MGTSSITIIHSSSSPIAPWVLFTGTSSSPLSTFAKHLRRRRGGREELDEAVRARAREDRHGRVELEVEDALAALFARGGELLDALARAEEVPEAHGAVVAARHEREARRVDPEQRRRVEVRKHRVCALAYVRQVDARQRRALNVEWKHGGCTGGDGEDACLRAE